jgi:hypothetical protein
MIRVQDAAHQPTRDCALEPHDVVAVHGSFCAYRRSEAHHVPCTAH